MIRSIVSALIAGDLKQLTGHVKRSIVMIVLACLSLIVAAGFLIGAAYIAVAERYGDLYAALGFGAGFFALAIVLLIMNSMRARAYRRRQEQQTGHELKALAATAVIAALPALLKARGGMAGVLMPILGLVALKIYDENRSDEESED